MSRTFVGEILIFLLLVGSNLAERTDLETLNDGSILEVHLTNLYDSVPYIKQQTIAPNSKVTLNVTNISSSASFIIFQIHTYQYNVTLSYDENYLSTAHNRSVFGSNIGLFVRLNSSNITQLFLRNDNTHVVDAMLVSISYNKEAPIPGGCNMEFNTEIAPYAKVLTRDTMVIVDVQPGSVPLNESASPVCEKNPVKHEMYRMYLSEQDFSVESYFSAITSMLTVTNIKENGQKISNSIIASPMRRVFSAYTGTGSVYVAVVTHEGNSAAYVPTFSYACNPIVDPDSCQVLNDTFSKLVCAACFFVGLFSIFAGHKSVNCSMALPVFFTGTVIGYIVTHTESIAIALGIGLGIVMLWKFFDVCCHMAFSTLLFALTPGLFFACVAYYHSPESFIIIQNDWIFWTLFATVTLTVSLIMMILYFFGRVITCAIFASFMTVLPIDYYAGSALKYIIINIVRRATVPDFRLAVVQPPVQAKDVTLILLWVCLALIRCFKERYAVRLSTETTPLLPDRMINSTLPRYYSRSCVLRDENGTPRGSPVLRILNRVTYRFQS